MKQLSCKELTFRVIHKNLSTRTTTPTTDMKPVNRVIGVRHRNKMTTEGEARPTALCIAPAGDPANTVELLLENEQDEVDWAHGHLPIAFREATSKDDPADFRPWHLQWKKVKEGESTDNIPKSHLRKVGKIMERLHKVPSECTGYQPGDIIVMLSGGSGNILAHMLSRVGEKIGSSVVRTSAARAKAFRAEFDSSGVENMHTALMWMWVRDPDKFRELLPRHRDQVEVREAYITFEKVQNDRKSCGLRLKQRAKNRVYMGKDSGTEEMLALEERYKEILSSDKVHQALQLEEEIAVKDALKIMKGMPVYHRVLEPISGIGPRIALRLIASIPDITAFETEAQFAAYCGVHVLGLNGKKLQKGETPPAARGVFPRRRRGVDSDWKPVLRQALFLFDEQLVRNPGSHWGQKRADIKAKYRVKHPEPVEEEKDGRKVKRYTNGHIHKMACWKTLNKFSKWLFRELKKLEAEPSGAEVGGERQKVA